MIIQASVAISVDGYADDASAERLVLSHRDDWQEVYALRTGYDAVMVGAETVRRDNPSLRLKDEALRQRRRLCGLEPDPVRVTVTASGNLDAGARFFTAGEGRKIVLAAADVPAENRERLARVATVLPIASPVTVGNMVGALEAAGINSLFLEGGSRLLTEFLTGNRVDLLRVAVAPFFVGDAAAPRFIRPGKFPFGPARRMEVLQVRRVGDMSVTDYALSSRGADYFRLRQAIGQAALCPPSDSAYSVGAVIVTAGGEIYTGYSRETDEHNHAEEEAIRKAEKAGAPLQGAVIYSSMEPCSARKSKLLSCTSLIISHKMGRVVFAAYEPEHFVRCEGASLLRQAGIGVTAIGELAAEAMLPNMHIRF